MTTKPTPAEVLKKALDEVERLKTELSKKEARIAFLDKRVNPLSILAMQALGVPQLPWEDDAALRALIREYFEKERRMRSDTVQAATLDAILEYLRAEEAAPEAHAGAPEASAEKLLEGEATRQ